MKTNLNIGILYLCIHKKLEEKVNLSRNVNKDRFYRMLGEVFHVPKNMRVVVMNEMKKKGLIEIEKNNPKEIKVCSIDIDLERDANKFYEWIGLWKDY